MDDHSVDTTSQEQWPWRLALDSIPPPLIILRPSGEIVEANAPMCLLLGLRRNELLAQSWRLFFPEAGASLDAMLPAIVSRQIAMSILETSLRRWDGTVYPVLLTLRPPRRDQDQGKDHILCTMTTAGQPEQRRTAWLEHMPNHTTFMDQQAMESVVQGLALCDESGRIHEVNEALCAMLGYHRQLLRQSTFSWLELASLARRAILHQKIQACLHGESKTSFEMELVDASGVVLPVLLTCHVLDTRSATNQALFFMAVTDLRPVKANQALRELQLVKETEGFWRQLFENLTEGLGIFGVNGTIFTANQALLKMTGYTREDIAGGLSWYDVVAPDHLEQVMERALHVMERHHEPAIPWQADLLDVHGHRVPVLLRGTALPPSPQGEARLAVAFSDISALRQRDAALIKERGYWQDIVSTVSEAVLVIGADQTVHELNPAACILLGVDKEQLQQEPVKLDWRRHIPAADQDHVLAAVACFAAGDATTACVEATFVDAQGRERPVLIRGRLLSSQSAWAEQDAEPRMVLVITDITALKVRERALAQTMEFWRAIFETAQDAMAVLSLDGRIHEANPAFLSLLAPAPMAEQAHQQLSSWYQLIPEHRLESALAEVQRVLHRDAAAPRYTLEVDIKTIDGRSLTVLVRGERLERLPEWTEDRFVLSLVDITQLKAQAQEIERKNQELEEAGRAKSEFFAVMSHELRTPLNAIIGFSEVLRDGLAGPLLDEQLDAAQEILKAGQHMLSLVNDILDLSKVASGRMEFRLAPVDPGHALASAVASMKEQARQKSIQLGLQLQENLPACIVDERHFQQMILNYLANALKFTSEGSVTVTARVTDRSSILQHPGCIESASLSAGDHFLEVCVADTGIGIAPEHQARLFRHFEQVDSSLSRQYQGTGLGLALVKSLAELQGGAVGLISSLGAGSRFYFWVPVVESNDSLQDDQNSGFPDQA